MVRAVASYGVVTTCTQKPRVGGQYCDYLRQLITTKIREKKFPPKSQLLISFNLRVYGCVLSD